MSDPIMLQKGCILRVTVNENDGGVRTSIDHNSLYNIDMRDIIFIIGSLRQLEHKLLEVYNERVSNE